MNTLTIDADTNITAFASLDEASRQDSQRFSCSTFHRQRTQRFLHRHSPNLLQCRFPLHSGAARVMDVSTAVNAAKEKSNDIDHRT
jgi:hypothetical protein